MERNAVLNLRMKKALKERIEADAKSKQVPASVVARRILAEYYEGRE